MRCRLHPRPLAALPASLALDAQRVAIGLRRKPVVAAVDLLRAHTLVVGYAPLRLRSMLQLVRQQPDPRSPTMRRPNPDVASLQATYSTRPGYLAVLVSAGPGYTDEYTFVERLDRLLWECEDRGLGMAVVQGGADGADAMGPRMGPPQRKDQQRPD